MVRLITEAHTGLKTLYQPPNPGSISIDIVAIHGLGAHPNHTWTQNVNVDPREEPRYVNWLCESSMLPEAVPTARIMRYGYKSQWFGDEKVESGTTLISDVAKDLLKELEIERKTAPNRSLIFIAHSFGGLLLIKALRLSSDSPRNWLNPFGSTAGLVFLGTPFRGKQGMTQSDMVKAVLKKYKPDQVHGKSLDLAVPDNEYLEQTVELFLDTRKSNPIPIWCFYETLPSNQGAVVGGDEYMAVIVPKPSACLDPWGGIEVQPLQRNHYNMNKFGNASEAAYRSVREAITKIAKPLLDTRKNSLLDQADAWIRDKHYTADRLKIERLSGDVLGMKQCYINLAIVERPGTMPNRSNKGPEGNRLPQSSPFSLVSRLKIKTPDKEIQIELPTIFDPRKGHDGRTTNPRRVLIRGRAGVGKTTLCKKIVHEFLSGTWSKFFRRVLWLPLRRLKTWNSETYNFEKLFYREYFSGCTNGEVLANKMWHALEDIDSGRTLFVLDGLDEVSREWNSDDTMHRFLLQLLNQPDVVITSRPYSKLPASVHDPDLELETIGFYPHQVTKYLEKVFSDPGRVDEVQSFLQSHWLIQGLVRIPIQLDALCFTWTTGFGDNTTPRTMTAVYEAIEQSLWKKDILRLDKSYGRGRLVTEGDIKTLRSSEVKAFVSDEIDLLENLAFTGLFNDVIDFDSKHRDAISEQFKTTEWNLSFDETLARLSFLRTSDPSAEFHNRNYHFLHLTFQEYFAARYFARQWKARRPLTYPVFKSQRNEETDPVEFLRTHKYAARYDILWRFTAGLLDAGGGEGPLHFFQTIEQEPRDLLGPAHQRLVMHCLSEVSTVMPLRKHLEEKLTQWLLFECEFKSRSRLASEEEFPEPKLEIALRKGSDEQKIKIVQSLETRSRIPSSVITLMASWLGDDISRNLKIAVCRMLGCNRSSLPDEILKAVVTQLEDVDFDVRSTAMYTLGTQSNLPNEILKTIVAQLEDIDSDIRSTAIYTLGTQSTLSNEILKAIVAQLGDVEWDVRIVAAEALGSQSNLPDEILKAMVAKLEDVDQGIRINVVEALGRQSSFPDEILKAVVLRLEDVDHDVRMAALDALGSQSNLPDEILKAIIARLEDVDSDVRSAAMHTLGSQSNLPDEILKAVVARLEDMDSDVRSAAMHTLGSQSNLPDEILKAVVARLDDVDSDVRSAAVSTLGSQSNLPDEILKAVVLRLEDVDHDVRMAAVEALGRQSSFPDEILKAVVLRLEDVDHDVRMAALDALGSQSNLPNEILKAIVAQFKDWDSHARIAAMDTLGRQLSLPNKILKAIVAQLEDVDIDVRMVAVHNLGFQSNLPNEILKAMVIRLEDVDDDVRSTAVHALGSQSNLPNEILRAIVARLEDIDWEVRIAAAEALHRQSNLPDEILNFLAIELKSNEAGRKLEAILRKHAEFYSTLLDRPFAESLYQILLRRSFKEHCSWYIKDYMSCLDMQDGNRRGHIRNEQEFRDMIHKAKQQLFLASGNTNLE